MPSITQRLGRLEAAASKHPARSIVARVYANTDTTRDEIDALLAASQLPPSSNDDLLVIIRTLTAPGGGPVLPDAPHLVSVSGLQR